MKQKFNNNAQVSTRKNTEILGKEPLQVKFRYEEIRTAIQKKNYSALHIDVISQTSHHKECQIKAVNILGCKVWVWFEENRNPKVYLIPEGRLAKIYITDLIRDTAFYEQLCSKKSA